MKNGSANLSKPEAIIKLMEELENAKTFEFVENPFDDIKNGQFSQWRRIARLAKGLEEIHKGADSYGYYSFDPSYKEGGKEYNGDIKGFKMYKPITANEDYLEIINKIAVLELKKVGGGTYATSEISKATKHYTEHIGPFEDLIIKQVELIDPTVIICLGRENGKCISELLKKVKESAGECIWIEGYHHQFSSNANFYDAPLESYKNELK